MSYSGMLNMASIIQNRNTHLEQGKEQNSSKGM